MNKEKLMRIALYFLVPILMGSLGFNVNGAINDDGSVDFKQIVKEEMKEVTREVLQEELPAILQPINDKLDDIELQAYNGDIIELSLALSDARTVAQVDEIVNFWIENGWNSQISAIKNVAENERAMDKLRNRLYSDEIFRALMSYAT